MFTRIRNESVIYIKATENDEKCLAVNYTYNDFADTILHDGWL